MIPVGLDIGTGFTKVCGNGRRASIASLYSCIYSDGAGLEEHAGGSRRTMREATGRRALEMGAARNGILVRPVKHGVPHNDQGFAALARAAMSAIGVRDSKQAVIAAGVTYDARDKAARISRVLNRALSPAGLRVVPQAYGTLKSCGKREGTVVNIGHGTTEIITVRPGMHEGVSIPKAGSFVTDQLDKRRGSYVDWKGLFARDEALTSRLVGMLAGHIADEVSRASSGGVILSGGGALLPGMREHLERLLGAKVEVPDDPVFSNAAGLEMIAARMMRDDSA